MAAFAAYFFVITIQTDVGPASLASILNAGQSSTAQARYDAAFRAVRERTEAKGIDVPEDVPVTFYSCEPN